MIGIIGVSNRSVVNLTPLPTLSQLAEVVVEIVEGCLDWGIVHSVAPVVLAALNVYRRSSVCGCGSFQPTLD